MGGDSIPYKGHNTVRITDMNLSHSVSVYSYEVSLLPGQTIESGPAVLHLTSRFVIITKPNKNNTYSTIYHNYLRSNEINIFHHPGSSARVTFEVKNEKGLYDILLLESDHIEAVWETVKSFKKNQRCRKLFPVFDKAGVCVQGFSSDPEHDYLQILPPEHIARFMDDYQKQTKLQEIQDDGTCASNRVVLDNTTHQPPEPAPRPISRSYSPTLLSKLMPKKKGSQFDKSLSSGKLLLSAKERSLPSANVSDTSLLPSRPVPDNTGQQSNLPILPGKPLHASIPPVRPTDGPESPPLPSRSLPNENGLGMDSPPLPCRPIRKSVAPPLPSSSGSSPPLLPPRRIPIQKEPPRPPAPRSFAPRFPSRPFYYQNVVPDRKRNVADSSACGSEEAESSQLKTARPSFEENVEIKEDFSVIFRSSRTEPAVICCPPSEPFQSRLPHIQSDPQMAYNSQQTPVPSPVISPDNLDKHQNLVVENQNSGICAVETTDDIIYLPPGYDQNPKVATSSKHKALAPSPSTDTDSVEKDYQGVDTSEAANESPGYQPLGRRLRRPYQKLNRPYIYNYIDLPNLRVEDFEKLPTENIDLNSDLDIEPGGKRYSNVDILIQERQNTASYVNWKPLESDWSKDDTQQCRIVAPPVPPRDERRTPSPLPGKRSPGALSKYKSHSLPNIRQVLFSNAF